MFLLCTTIGILMCRDQVVRWIDKGKWWILLTQKGQQHVTRQGQRKCVLVPVKWLQLFLIQGNNTSGTETRLLASHLGTWWRRLERNTARNRKLLLCTSYKYRKVPRELGKFETPPEDCYNCPNNRGSGKERRCSCTKINMGTGPWASLLDINHLYAPCLWLRTRQPI